MKGLITRSLSGIVYVAVIVASLVTNATVFMVFMLLLQSLAMTEFGNLVNRPRQRYSTLCLDLSGGWCISLGLYFLGTGTGGTPVCAVLFLAYVIVRLVWELYSHDSDPIGSLARSFMAQIYISLPMGLMGRLFTSHEAGNAILLAMFVMIWLNDTGAFCVGSLIGRHKMFPRISPKKSWEGLVGGVVFAVASAFAFKYLFGSWYEHYTLGQLLGMGAVVAAFATWGDLVESMIKRTLGVKDSGNLIPGHGGILDRIDSLLLVLPALTVYLILISL